MHGGLPACFSSLALAFADGMFVVRSSTGLLGIRLDSNALDLVQAHLVTTTII